MSTELAQEIMDNALAGADMCNCCNHIVALSRDLLESMTALKEERDDLLAEAARLRGEVYRLSECVRVAKIMLEVSK